MPVTSLRKTCVRPSEVAKIKSKIKIKVKIKIKIKIKIKGQSRVRARAGSCRVARLRPYLRRARCARYSRTCTASPTNSIRSAFASR